MKQSCLALVLAAVWLGGCANRHQATALDPVVEPARADMAMGHRSFEPSSAEYENTAVIAWSTRSPWVVGSQVKDPGRPVAEPVVFLANLVTMPVSLFVEPPFADQKAWRDGGVPSSYSASAPFDTVVSADAGPIKPGLDPAVREAWEPNYRKGRRTAEAPTTLPLIPLTPATAVPEPSQDATTTEPAKTEPANSPALTPAPTTPESSASPAVTVEPVPSTQRSEPGK
jgi:hypothetical protein